MLWNFWDPNNWLPYANIHLDYGQKVIYQRQNIKSTLQLVDNAEPSFTNIKADFVSYLENVVWQKLKNLYKTGAGTPNLTYAGLTTALLTKLIVITAKMI